MKTTCAIAALAVCVLLVVVSPAVRAQALREYTAPLEQAEPAEPAPPKEEKKEQEEPRERLKREAERLTRVAGEKVESFAAHADDLLEKLAKPAAKGWIIFALVVLVGMVSLLWGWTLIQSLLIPFAPIWGLTTGAVTAFCIVQAFYTGRPPWFKVTLVAVGVTLGIGLYLFAALRAKPVAAFLVVLSPFLMIAAFFFDYNAAVGIAFFFVGFLAGFAALIEVRPLAIVSSSILGGVGVLGGWGLLSHLTDPKAPFVRDSFEWLIKNPLMLVIGCAVLAFIGTNFQFTTGPRGTLED